MIKSRKPEMEDGLCLRTAPVDLACLAVLAEELVPHNCIQKK